MNKMWAFYTLFNALASHLVQWHKNWRTGNGAATETSKLEHNYSNSMTPSFVFRAARRSNRSPLQLPSKFKNIYLSFTENWNKTVDKSSLADFIFQLKKRRCEITAYMDVFYCANYDTWKNSVLSVVSCYFSTDSKRTSIAI